LSNVKGKGASGVTTAGRRPGVGVLTLTVSMTAPRSLPSSLALAIFAIASACSPATVGMNRMASALSKTADAYATDDDPEFVRLAAPSTLKMVEMMIDQQPSHEGLLMTACSGFTQYAYGFLHVESDLAGAAAEAQDLRDRAGRMYRRARGYCLRALELRHHGFGEVVSKDPDRAAAVATRSDVPALFWTGASWAAELSLADIQLTRLTELVAVRTLLGRVLELDEAWELGAVHEAFIALDGLPPLLGGSASRAREHFERAVALSGGQSALAYVTMAWRVSRPAKNRAEFERMLKQALAVDVNRRPNLRLANLIAQRHARALLARIDRLF
jgi:TRAP transporter TatT component family protein